MLLVQERIRGRHLADLPPELRGHKPAADVPAALLRPVAATTAAAEPSSPVASPAALLPVPASIPVSGDWHEALRHWAEARFASGDEDLLGHASPLFERTLIEVALAACKGQRQEAARRLGWGRNTLTRKIKELGLSVADDEDEDG